MNIHPSFQSLQRQYVPSSQPYPLVPNYPNSYPESWSRRERFPLVWRACVFALGLIALVVTLPVYFSITKKHRVPVASTVMTGSDGSTVTTEDGSTFTYQNQFGGFWVSDSNNPFNDGAQPNSWTPPLNTSWKWGQDKIYGVNLGGLFVLEPFITPALFQRYPGTLDEWTLSEAMLADTGNLQQIEDHYNTFIVEQDIAEIAGAGLNWVRVPIPFWAIETWPGEPFLERTSWTYFLRLVSWCRKYGLRINLDLHTVPGSQNGYNHSGKQGQIDFLYGVMGVANAQRTLSYIRILIEFISQPEYSDIILVFGIINEPLMTSIGQDQISSFYLEVYTMIRGITGIGSGPYISIHDGFIGPATWAGFLSGADRMMLDEHLYFAFNGQPNTEPIATSDGPDAGGKWPAQVCNGWAKAMTDSQRSFGVTVAGEFSNGYNDCGLFVDGVNGAAQYGDCTLFQDSSNWNSSMKAGLKAYTLASMDALQNWFFWTWKVGDSLNNRVEAPLWSYKLGISSGWIPEDPRTAMGMCDSIGASFSAFDGQYQSWQTGGPGAGTIVPDATTKFGQFPYPTISGINVPASLLPTYTATGTIKTLPVPSWTGTSFLNGWFDATDTEGIFTAVAGCSYPDPWDATAAAVPTACTGA
ncbi:glycoside hydrolase family 5 protein [Mycena floridula]|nr:glycoside hydrolase family 5 protein [Mycena floridula]